MTTAASAPPPAPPAPSAAASRRATLPWVITAVAVVVAVACAGALVRTRADGDRSDAPTGPRVERTFATPEEAVGYFADRVAAGDLGAALEAFALAPAVDGYSFEAEGEYVGAMTPATWLPASSEGYRAVDADLRRGDAASQVRSFVRAIAAPDLEDGVTIVLDDRETAADIAAALAPERLSGLEVVSVDPLQAPLREGADRDPFVARAAVYGADELAEVAILYETSEGLAHSGATLLRYGDRWSLWSLSSALVGAMRGELVPTSEPEYADLVARFGAS